MDLLTSLTGLQIGAVALALVFGGLMKGVTGAGAPIIAIPVMSSFLDLPHAVMIMLLPNLLTNVRQAVVFRSHRPEGAFLLPYLSLALIGVVVGTFMLVNLPARPLNVTVALAILAYVGWKAARPSWHLTRAQALWMAGPAGAVAGVLQGATGLSAPATLSFLHSLGYARKTFIAVLALLFLVFSVTHIVALGWVGALDGGTAVLSLIAVAPLFAGLELGSRLADRINPQVFERGILVLLLLLAVRALLVS